MKPDIGQVENFEFSILPSQQFCKDTCRGGTMNFERRFGAAS